MMRSVEIIRRTKKSNQINQSPEQTHTHTHTHRNLFERQKKI